MDPSCLCLAFPCLLGNHGHLWALSTLEHLAFLAILGNHVGQFRLEVLYRPWVLWVLEDLQGRDSLGRVCLVDL